MVARVPGTVSLEWLLPPGNPLVCAVASASRHPRFPSVVHVITVATALGDSSHSPEHAGQPMSGSAPLRAQLPPLNSPICRGHGGSERPAGTGC
jgi:hypothetical protein